jgi:hypothetical protein
MFKVKSEHPETAGAGDVQDIQDVLGAAWGYCRVACKGYP